MTPATIGQVVVFEGQRAAVCKMYGTKPAKFAVIFFDDYSGCVLNEMCGWTVTGEIVSQDVVDELLAEHERVAAENEAEMDKAYEDVERAYAMASLLLRAEKAREARRLRALSNRGN